MVPLISLFIVLYSLSLTTVSCGADSSQDPSVTSSKSLKYVDPNVGGKKDVWKYKQDKKVDQWAYKGSKVDLNYKSPQAATSETSILKEKHEKEDLHFKQVDNFKKESFKDDFKPQRY